ncbi:glycosyltransferase [Ornithobacterium rhinotracheale]|uniref:glycosyltransferase n=1 Tax=Ornithobacterium rhinotracheale TaxID=28251 RepID=UPI004039F38B
MRILQIIDSLNMGGAEKLLLDSIPLYVARGLTMDIALLTDNDYPFTKALEAQNCSKIFKLSKGSVYNPMLIFKLQKLLKNYDIAHVHLFPAQYWAVLANLLNGNKTKLIFTEHNTSNNRINNQLYAKIDRLVYPYYEKTVCITKEIQDIFKQHTNLDINRLPIINNGVDIKTFTNASAIERNNLIPSIKQGDRIIVQVSAFRLQKDQKTLIKALSFLPENFKLILVGDGEYKEECQILSKSLKLENRCFFLGKRTDIPNILKSADYIVLSSKYEGLSLSSIEGMASGRPFIASDVPGLKEIVGGYGILFPQGEAQILAQKILSLENNPALYQEIVQKCQARAKEFDIHRMVDKHIDLFKQVMKS